MSCGKGREWERVAFAVARDVSDEDLFGRGGLSDGAESFAAFVVVEECGFASRGREGNEPLRGRLGVADDVGGELVRVQASVRMEGRGERDVQAFEKHFGGTGIREQGWGDDR